MINKLRKASSIFLALLMVLTLMPVSAMAAVTAVTISSGSDLTIEKGGTLELSAEVSADGEESTNVTWSLEGDYSSGTSISSSGILSAAADETAENITVKATSTADTEKNDTVTVTVTEPVPTVSADETDATLTVSATSDADDSVSGAATVTVTETAASATVTGVTVSPSEVSVTKGETQSFSATVTGENNPSQDVIWSIVETVAEGTSISEAGVLTVASDETAESLTVRATFAVDSSKAATATVTITEPAGMAAMDVTEYAILMSIGDNGTATIEGGLTSAAAGTEIVLNVTPSAGYELKTLSYLDYSNLSRNDIEQSEGTYSFTMPAGKVSIMAEFWATLEEGEYHITIDPLSSRGTMTFSVGETSNVAVAKVNDIVTIHYTPHKPYRIVTEMTVTSAESSIDDPVATQLTRNYEDGAGTWRFTMPATDVTITTKTDNMKLDYSLVTELNNGISKDWQAHVKSAKGFVGCYSQNGLTISVDNVIDGKYYTHEVKLKSTENFALDALQPAVTKGATENDATAYSWGKFLVTSAAITVTFTEVTAYDITNSAADLDGDSTLSVVNGTMARAGDTVTLTVIADTTNGYYYDAENDLKPVVTDGNGESVTVATVDGASSNEASFTFTMPEDDVIIDAPKGLIKQYNNVTIAVASNLVSVSPVAVRAGETVTMTVSAPETGSVRYIKVQGGGAPIYLDADTTSFTMPEGDTVTVAAYTAATWLDEGNYDANLYKSSVGDWTLYDAADLAAFAKKLQDDMEAFSDCTVTIAQDIELSDYLWVPVEAGRNNNITLDGKGHAISGMHVTDFAKQGPFSYPAAGLFSGTKAVIQNLTLEGTIDAHLRSGQNTTYIGGLAGAGGTVYNCTVNVDINMDGIMGENNVRVGGVGAQPGAIRNTAVLGDISAQDMQLAGLNVGGIHPSNNEIDNSYCLSDITIADSVSISGALYLSGLMNGGYDGKQNNIYFGGSINTSADASSQYVSGVATSVYGAQGSCYSYYSPTVPEGVSGADNFKTVDSATNHVQGTETTLLDTLNAWVAENQNQNGDGDNVYRKWTTGSQGKPEFAAENANAGAKYAITKVVEGDGNVAVDPQGVAGQEMTVSVTPARFSEVESVTCCLTGDSARTVSVYENDNGSYSFYMPSEAVTVKVVFTDISYDITLSQTGQGATTIVGEDSNSAEKAKAGEPVNITLVPDADNKYRNVGLTVTDGNSNEVSLTEGSNSNEWSFTMPESAVTVNVTYELCGWYEDDGSLKPGTYTVDAIFGSYYHMAQDKLYGAMGYEASHTDMTFTVNEDGSIHVDSYDASTIHSPIGFVGLGEVKISGLQTGNTDGNYRLKDDVDLGEVNETNYPLTLDMDNITSWCTVYSETGEKTVYTDSVYRTEVTSTTSDETLGYIYTSEDEGSIKAPGLSFISNQVFPNALAFDIPSTVDIKNTGDPVDALIHLATFPAQMGYYTQMLILPDFGTIREAEECNEETETVNVALWHGEGAPGARKPLPMGEDALDSTATLTTLKDGSRTLTLTFGEAVVAGLHGHLCSVRFFPGDKVTDAYQNCINLQNVTDVTVDSWFTSNLNSAERPVYNGQRHKMETSNGAIYYTTDDVAAKWDGQDTNLVYPGTVTITLPDYFDASDTANCNNEIYIWTYIDAMGSDTSSGTLLKVVVGEIGGGTPQEKNPLEELIAAVTDAKQLLESNYTVGTWPAFKSALDAAQELITKGSTDEAAIAGALTALNGAMGNLELELTDTTVEDDGQIGVTAQATDGAIPKGGKLVVAQADTTTSATAVGNIQSKLSSGSQTVTLDKAIVLDFKVLDGSNQEATLGSDSFVKLTIDIPAGMNTNKIKFFHVDDSNNITELEGEVADGKFVAVVSGFSYYVLAEKTVTTSPGGSPGGPGGPSTVDVTKAGCYTIDVQLWREVANMPSMGNAAFEGVTDLLISDGNGGYKLQVATQPVKTSGYTTAITGMERADGGTLTYVKTGNFTTNTKYDGTAHEITYVKVFQIELDSVTDEYVAMKMQVPYTPMDAVGASSDGWLYSRLKIDWGSAVKVSDSYKLNPTTNPNHGSSSLDQDKTGNTSGVARDTTDEVTGVRLVDAEGVFPEDTDLTFSALNSGTSYKAAQAALKGKVCQFALFSVLALDGNGEAVTPDGSVKLYFPVPAGYNNDKVVIYRLNDDGSITMVKGTLSGIAGSATYIVQTRSLGIYVVAESVEDVATSIDAFTDLSGHWAKDYIRFIVYRGLFKGTSETAFGSDIAMDRGCLSQCWVGCPVWTLILIAIKVPISATLTSVPIMSHMWLGPHKTASQTAPVKTNSPRPGPSPGRRWR